MELADFRDYDFLTDLLQAKSPSGEETEALEVWTEKLESLKKPYGKNYKFEWYSDLIGNKGISVTGGNKIGKRKIMISAHIDEIAMIVGLIEDNGMMVLQNLAGIDRKTLPGAQVLVKGDNNCWHKGIIHKAPIHVEGKGKDADSAIKIENLKLDVGSESKDETEGDFGIHPGSLVVFERNINTTFGKNRLVGNALDDKIGVYIVGKVLEELLKSPNFDQVLEHNEIYFIACTQEESGLRGATIAAHNINPHLSIDLDVTFATDGGLVSKSKYGEIKLGKGVVIEYGQDKSRKIAQTLIDIAKQNSIKFQYGVSRCGGTNTSAIQLNAQDCETALLSIPNLSMHTQNETCDWTDINYAIELLTAAILSGRI